MRGVQQGRAGPGPTPVRCQRQGEHRHDVIRSARQSIQPSTSYHQELSLHDLGIVSSSQSYVRQATSAGTQAQASTSSARSYVSGGTAAYELTARIKAATRPPQLLALVSQHAPALNVIHLTAAATSLARSCTAPLEDSLGGPQSEATQQLAGFLRLVQARCSALDARGCANVVWAVARLRTSAASSGSALAVELDATMASLLPAATLHAHEFSPQHVANVLWALAVTDVSAHTQPNGSNAGGGSSGGGAEAVSGAAPEVAGASRPSSGGAVPSSSSANGSREPYGVNGSSAPYAAIGNTVPRSANGSSTAGPCANGSARASLQGQLLESARPHLASFTPQGAANTLWAAATLRASPSDEWLFDFFGTTQPALPQWGCQAAANTLWAAATLHAAPPPAWCDALWSATRRRLGTEWDAQALSNTLWAAGSLRLDVPHHWLAAAATACQSRLDKFSDQQLASALWGLARLAAGGGGGAADDDDDWGGEASTSAAAGPSRSRSRVGSRGAVGGSRGDSSTGESAAAVACFASAAATSLLSRQCTRTHSAAGDGGGDSGERAFCVASWSLARLGWAPPVGSAWIVQWAGLVGERVREWAPHSASACVWALATWRPAPPDGGDADAAAVESALGACLGALVAQADSDGRGACAPSLSVTLSAMAARHGRQRAPAGPAPLAHLLTAPVVAAAAAPAVLAPYFAAQTLAAAAPAPPSPPASASAPRPPASAAAAPRPHALRPPAAAVPTPLPTQQQQHAGALPSSQVPLSLLPSTSALVRAAWSHLTAHAQHAYSPRQLASSLWALSSLGAPPPDATWAVRVLLPALDARVRSGRMSDAEVAMATWAKARMRLPALSHVQFHTAGGPGGGASAAAAAAAAAAGGSADRGGGAARRPPLLSPSQLGSRSLAAALHACALASRARLMSPPEQVAALGLLAQLPAAAAGRGGGGGMDGRTLASSLTAAARLRYRPSPEWADDAWSAFAVVSGSSSGGMQRQRSAGSGGGNGGMAPGEAALSLWALASMRARPVGAVASAALLSAAGCTQQAQVSPQHLPGHTSSSSSAEAASPSQLQMRSRSQPQASAPSLVDALRLLHAAAAWRLSPGPARQLWAALTRPSTGTGNSGPLSRPGLLPLRALCSAMLHAGRIGAQPSPEWLRAAADRVEALVPTAGPREVAALLEAAALLAANRQRAAAASGGERTTTASGAARSEGTDEQLAAASSSSRSTRSSNAPLRAVFDACMERVDSGGLWCSGISSSGGGAYGTSDDARLLRSLVAHRRLTRWLDARGADDALTAYVLVSSAAAAALVPAAVVVPVVVAVVMSARAAGTTAAGNSGIVAPAMAPAFVPPAALAPMPEPRAPPTRLASLSTSQLLHVLRWATALSPPPATLPPQWLAAAGDTLGSRLAAMPTNDAVRVLPALLRAGFIPSRTWLGDYMATVFQRANGLSPAHAAAVTGALAKLDARLHAMWLQQLSVTYGDGQ